MSVIGTPRRRCNPRRRTRLALLDNREPSTSLRSRQRGFPSSALGGRSSTAHAQIGPGTVTRQRLRSFTLRQLSLESFRRAFLQGRRIGGFRRQVAPRALEGSHELESRGWSGSRSRDRRSGSIYTGSWRMCMCHIGNVGHGAPGVAMQNVCRIRVSTSGVPILGILSI